MTGTHFRHTAMATYERISITIEPELLAKLDQLTLAAGHDNRSATIRDLIRDRLVEAREGHDVVAGSLTVVYDHRERALSERLVDVAHDHHDIVLSTLHVHIDHDHCLEVSALRGRRDALTHYSDHVLGMKGVLHGKLVITSERP